MAHEFRLRRSVEFSDTDMAGIMHFAHLFRFMESTEHAFLRSLGFSVHIEEAGRTIGWPRVHASCDYKQPLRFEDEVEIHLTVREKKTRSLTYDFCFIKETNGDPPVEVARGALVVVCASLDATLGRLKAIPIPESIAQLIEAAPAPLAPAEARE